MTNKNKFEGEKGRHLEKPIALNEGIVLEEGDIESELSHNDAPAETTIWKTKEGFPSYYLNPTARFLMVYQESKPLYFRLKEGSNLLKVYVQKYG